MGIGSKEPKRRRRAVPSPVAGHLWWSCVTSAVAFVLVCYGLLAFTSRIVFAFLGAPVLLGLVLASVRLVRNVILLAEVRRQWAGRGLKCLVIHSVSPVWQDHIAREWLPRLDPVSVRLNWSERNQWPDTLEVRLFRRFCLAERNFNPAVLVFRGLRAPLVFRFYYAFHEVKHGNPQYLTELETELFRVLGIEK